MRSSWEQAISSLLQTGKERESDLPGESVSSAPVVELFDPLEPIGPRLGQKAWNGWVLGLLQRPDFEVAHASPRRQFGKEV